MSPQSNVRAAAPRTTPHECRPVLQQKGYRDARDVIWSTHDHHSMANGMWYDAPNNTPGRVGPEIAPPPDSAAEYFENRLDDDGAPFWQFWDNVRSGWGIRDLPNVLLVHFADLKRDMPGQVAAIAAFPGMEVTPGRMDDILHHFSFDYIEENATASVPLGGVFRDGGAQTFIHKGVNGRWRDEPSNEVSDRCLETAEREPGRDCAAWLVDGPRPAA